MPDHTSIAVKLTDWGRTYDYLTDEPVKKGDWVVVQIPNGDYLCGRVEAVHRTASSKATKWIVTRVYDDLYKSRMRKQKD